jgi:formylglycine-generating enzyme required for sulfatase activity
MSGCGPGQAFGNTLIPSATNIPILVPTEKPLIYTGGTPPENAKLGDRWTSPKDGMTLIYIPAGEFLMGSTDADITQALIGCSGCVFTDEKPQHKVYLDGYWMDKTEVTQGMYAKCVAAGGCQPASCSNGGDNYPVACVDWNNANSYCEWAGQRLPTEAEWEKGARGTDGRKYPWGNNDPTNEMANYNQNVGETSEVGHFPGGASPYGLLDMSGNVWEWVADSYRADYYSNSPYKNPLDPISGDPHVLRGGSWYDIMRGLRAALRGWDVPVNGGNFLGFRCTR